MSSSATPDKRESAQARPAMSPSYSSAQLQVSAASTTLVSSTVFECVMLPRSNSLSGTLIPRILQKGRHRRLIAVEVHRVQHAAGDPGKASYEECVVRTFVPASTVAKSEAQKRAKAQRRAAHKEGGAAATATAALENAMASLGEEDDESTVNSVSPEFIDGGAELRLPEHLNGTIQNWKPKYRFPIKSIRIKSTHKQSVTVEIKLGTKSEKRELLFDTIEESEKFQALLESQAKLEQDRASQKMKVAMGDEKSIRLDEKLTFLVEIVSAWDIPAGDYTSSDPYVSCLVDGEEVHRTDFISKTLNPIWTVTTGSLFLLNIDVKKLFRGEGLLCVMYDFDKFGGNERLGAVTIPPKTIYDAKGERMEFKLGPPPGKTDDVPGYMAVRIRRATKYDIEFMTQRSEAKRAFIPTKKPEELDSHKGGSGNIKSMLTRRSRLAKTGPNVGEREYRIRPCPDPRRVDETTWMTKDQLEAESLKESTQWVDAGSGRLGRVFVEIIGCDDLPNLDTGGFAGNKTDAFVSLVFEDAFTQTDIIDDTLSPRWMPWTKRAFIFHIMHSSSQLFLGVFDYDDGINPADDHDLVGRVSVDLSNLHKDTLYTMKYNLYTTARMSGRKRKGSITIRLRIEIEDERSLLLSAIEPPPNMFVNTKTRKEFRVVRFTCTGKYNMEKYSMKTINSYIEELLYLQHIFFYLQDGAITLLLWRGTLRIPVPFSDKEFMFPIHSVTAFLTMIMLVENPHWILSFFFGSIAWLMLTSQVYRRSLPEVWSRCKSFTEFVEALVLGNSRAPPDSIEAYENYDEAQAFLGQWQKRVEDAEAAATRAYEEQIKAQEEYEREMEEIGDTQDTDIATKTGDGLAIDPFKSLLFPVQQNLALICRYVRHVKHVISWQECYIAFWVTAGCALLSIICLFIPWFFFIKWTTRIVVWALFGPWMRLVDIYYVSKIKPLTEEEMQQKKEMERNARLVQTMTAVARARIRREDQAKLKAMKKYMFGKFITRVPVLKEDRYRDLPLPESTAQPFKPQPIAMAALAMADAGYKKIRLPGQHLVGDMIPKIEASGFTDAPIGQPTAHPALVDKDRPGGSILPGKDTTAAAYLRLGSLVVSAAILTWVGVPILAALTEHLVSYLHYKV